MITHRKTRTGCTQCKGRRIKCDETKPQCEKCRRTNRECSFQAAGPVNPPPPRAALGPSQDVFSLKEMELLHHFIMQTGITLVNSAALQRVWQTGAIDLALKHPFLMHTVLAISALHLATLRPEESDSLCVLAANHQDQGLAGFRSELAKFSQENCHALFASSILVIFYVPGSSGTRINADRVTASMINDVLFNAIIDWLRLIRGCGLIIERGRGWLEQGPLAALVPRRAWYQSINIRPSDEKAHNEDMYLASLERLWAPDTPVTKTRHDDAELEAYKASLVELRHSFARMSIAESPKKDCCWCTYSGEPPEQKDSQVSRIAAGLLWPMLVPSRLFELFEERKPEALILVAHNAVVIKRTTNDWWNRSPALKIIAGIAAALPAEYQAWIEWPLREIGYDPSTCKPVSPSEGNFAPPPGTWRVHHDALAEWERGPVLNPTSVGSPSPH